MHYFLPCISQPTRHDIRRRVPPSAERHLHALNFKFLANIRDAAGLHYSWHDGRIILRSFLDAMRTLGASSTRDTNAAASVIIFFTDSAHARRTRSPRAYEFPHAHDGF